MRKRNNSIIVRCNDDEKTRIKSGANKANLSVNEFMLRSALGKKIIVADGLQEVTKLQKAIGNNLNQVAVLANMERIKVVNLQPILDEHLKSTQMICEIAKQMK